MAEPLKNMFDPQVVERIGGQIARGTDKFDPEVFLDHALRGLEDLELMERSEQISRAIETAMSGTFEESVAALTAALHPETSAEISDMRFDENGIAGFAVMPLSSFVARNGLDKPEFSLEALRQMTMRSSSEFAVRPFFREHQKLTLETAAKWARDSNVHVRRLASEGSRPRLPWGIRLHEFVKDPAPILTILISLRDDPSEYVRRSVANSLNDIAKDHPDLVAGIAAEWSETGSPERTKLVKHACRTLIKDGHSGALNVFGFGLPDLVACDIRIGSEVVKLGETLDISLNLTAAKGPQKLLIDYVIHFMRANGKLSPKVFKWTELDLKEGKTRTLTKSHPYRKVTTRKDYAGTQKVTVQINGQDMGGASFEFSL